jgi:hypothetical protein
MRTFLRNESGQAIVDYVLTLLLLVSIVTIMATGFRRSLFSLWKTVSREVSAPCPGCAADPSIR